MLFRRFYAPILQDLQPAKCDTCRQARLCLRSGGNSSGLQEAGLAYQKKHLNGESSVDFIFVLLSPSLQQLATAKFGKFACSLAFVALSSNSTSCRCMSRQQPMFVLTYHHSSTSTRQGRCLLKGRRRLQTCLLAATGFLCFAPLL